MSGYLADGATQARADRWLDGDAETVDAGDLAPWESASEQAREQDWWDSLEELELWGGDEAAKPAAMTPLAGAADSRSNAAPQREPPTGAFFDYDHQAALAGALT